MLAKITAKNQITIPKKIMDQITENPADDVLLRCAHAGRVQYILSGDRHLLNLKTYRRTKILFPADVLSGVVS